MNDKVPEAEFKFGLRRWQALLLLPMVMAGEALFIYFGFFDTDAQMGLNARMRWLFEIMSWVGPIGVFGIGAALASTFGRQMRIVITPTHLIAPKPSRFILSKREISVPWNEIEKIALKPFAGYEAAIYVTTKTMKIVMPSNMFCSRDEFNCLFNLLNQAIRRQKHGLD